MKKSVIFALAIAAMSFASCKKKDHVDPVSQKVTTTAVTPTPEEEESAELVAFKAAVDALGETPDYTTLKTTYNALTDADKTAALAYVNTGLAEGAAPFTIETLEVEIEDEDSAEFLLFMSVIDEVTPENLNEKMEAIQASLKALTDREQTKAFAYLNEVITDETLRNSIIDTFNESPELSAFKKVIYTRSQKGSGTVFPTTVTTLDVIAAWKVLTDADKELAMNFATTVKHSYYEQIKWSEIVVGVEGQKYSQILETLLIEDWDYFFNFYEETYGINKGLPLGISELPADEGRYVSFYFKHPATLDDDNVLKEYPLGTPLKLHVFLSPEGATDAASMATYTEVIVDAKVGEFTEKVFFPVINRHSQLLIGLEVNGEVLFTAEDDIMYAEISNRAEDGNQIYFEGGYSGHYPFASLSPTRDVNLFQRIY